MDNGEVVVTAPPHVPERYIYEFIEQNEIWIAEKLAKSAVKQRALTDDRETIFFRGKEYQFRINVSAAHKPEISIINDKLVVTSPSEDHSEVRKILEKWYRKQAEKRFKERVPLLADLVGRDIVTVSIRSQRTRWGSCSSRLQISLNWRLIMAPDEVSDYVIYHELAHLTHMNHSKRFWQLVADYLPDYKNAEKWLKTHHELLKF